MEHGSKKYILLSDLQESDLESNSMTAGIWGVLSGYVFGGESIEKPEVLRGELLQSLPSNELQDASGKIQLAGIKQRYLRTECFESQLAVLSDEEAELLLAVRSYTARCNMVEQQMLDQLLAVAEGSQVFVYHKELNRYLAALVCYKGAVPPHNGVMFGVQIVDTKYRHQGTCDGTFRCKRYFKCPQGSGMFVSADKIRVSLEKENNGFAPSEVASPHTRKESDRADQSSDTEDEYEHLKEEPGVSNIKRMETVRDGKRDDSAKCVSDSEQESERQEAVSILTGSKPPKDKRLIINRKEEYLQSRIKELQFLLHEETAKNDHLQEQLKLLSNSFEQEQKVSSFLQKSLEEEKTNLCEQRKCFDLECEEFEKRLLEERRVRTKIEKQLEQALADARRLKDAATVAEQLQRESENRLQQEIDSLKFEKEDLSRQLHEFQARIQTVTGENMRDKVQDWIINRNEIQVGTRQLGIGGWGAVSDGKFRGCDVAVKQIHKLILSPHNRRLFEREMAIAAQCRHPCLLQFIGATNDDGSPLFVTELLDTSLRAVLEKRSLQEEEILRLAMDVARGLNYLHLHKPSPIIHRDINSANVLLWRRGESWRAKVSDYGAANFMWQCNTVSPGCIAYAAPEALSSNQSPKIDVYSFGLLLCEMCNRELPVQDMVRSQISSVANQKLRTLIDRCVEEDPDDRLSMTDIIKELEELSETMLSRNE